jgi:hypothetical protein
MKKIEISARVEVPENCQVCRFSRVTRHTALLGEHTCTLFNVVRHLHYSVIETRGIPRCAQCRAAEMVRQAEVAAQEKRQAVYHDYLYRDQYAKVEAQIKKDATEYIYRDPSSLGQVHDSLYFKTKIDPLVRETRMATAEMKADRLEKDNERLHKEMSDLFTRYETILGENNRMSKIIDRLMDRLFKLRKIIEEV